ncbi:hypothetical protein DFJ63DRAFT_314939 [Scheffersomyces coipomensis]|uniref:uncharacterized protein n=1 Tax=Scheffersomyces coipomensis TaxID=1788519 RepID=UPI00315C928F
MKVTVSVKENDEMSQEELVSISPSTSMSIDESLGEEDHSEERDSNASGRKRYKLTERRSVLACIRCRRRKTKCSGSYPCQTCIRFNHMCEYPRKPKRIQIYDIEVEQYQMQIQQLKSELDMIKSSTSSTSHSITIAPSSTSSYNDDSDAPDISVWLGSGSCELICWNLKQFTSKQFINSQLPVNSPDFNTFIEEKTYNYLFASNHQHYSENVTESILQSITLPESLKLFDAVISFINVGYLTITNIEQFKLKLNQLFNSNGGKLPLKVITSNDRYFILKLLMILSLGEIYDRKLTIGRKKKKSHTIKKEQLPGLKYFKIVLNHLPSPFYYYDDYKSLENMIEIIELLGLISIYLRMIDKKTLAVSFTLQSLQLCISLNLHKESSLRSFEINNDNLSNQYLNKLWWKTFCLNRFYSVRISQPLLLHLNDISNDEYNNVKDSSIVPTSSDDYANETCMKFYIELAKISDRITNELYKSNTTTKQNKSQYLRSIISIMEILINWINNIPPFLRLNLHQVSDNDRSIYSLHLNYLHHIYLTNIPMLINLVKFKIINYYKHNQFQSHEGQSFFPTNIKNLINSILNSSKLTINIFLSLINRNKLTIFGMTDLDFLFSCSLVFLICLILINEGDDKDDIQNYLKTGLNIINEMKLSGNLIAKGKLFQIVELILSLKKLLIDLGYQDLINHMNMFQHDASEWSQVDEEKITINKTASSISLSTSTTSITDTTTNSDIINYQYQINDILDCTFLSTLPPASTTTTTTTTVENTSNSGGAHTPTPFLYNLTEEDINFMEQFFIDF